MPRPNILVIAVDGLRASALGAYGNTWYRTPTFDHIAANSVLCDWCFVDSPDLSLVYRGLWQATSALRTAPTGDLNWSLPATLAQLGYHCRLITDSEELTNLTASQHFTEAVLLQHEPSQEVREVQQTCAASVLAEALVYLEDDRPKQQPWFLWTHLRGLYGAWDAPHELALSLVDEEDAAPVFSYEPPDEIVDRALHADEIFAQTCRYAAQIKSLDLLLAPLCDFIESGAAGDCMMLVLGTRGFPLGEHGKLGGVDQRLYSEQLHVPFLLRLPQEQRALSRVSQLTYPADLPATILSFIDLGHLPPGDGHDAIDEVTPRRSILLATGGNSNLSIRTPAWYLRMDAESTDDDLAEDLELFVKPDDRWEANDIASRCPEIAADLAGLACTERDRIAAGEPAPTALPASRLIEPMS